MSGIVTKWHEKVEMVILNCLVKVPNHFQDFILQGDQKYFKISPNILVVF